MPKFFRAGAVSALALAAASFASAQTPAEPGATPGVTITNISKNDAMHASVFPQVAVSPANPNVVAVAWRRYNLPIDTNALEDKRVADCHVALSSDGGKTWRDRNMMDVLKTPGGNGEPHLAGCNAPWVTIAKDGTMYFGGALFTTGGELMKEPKAGRAGVTVSTDNGATWSPLKVGITLKTLAPGLKGLAGGMEQQDTPWDGANGKVDPTTGTFYSTAGAYITASDDKGATFSTVYSSRGTISPAFGKIVAGRTVMEIAGYPCPCLVAAISDDKGKTWSDTVLARDGEYNREGTVRYPTSAASPANPGHFAIAAYQPDHRTVKVYYTTDSGKTWKMATPRATPQNVTVNTANQVGVGYTSDGRLLLTWRGFRNVGAFNTFVAMLDGDTFGPTVKVSPQLSIYPPLLYDGNYSMGGGDFVTWVTGNAQNAYVAFPYAPRGLVEDTVLATVPLTLLTAK